MQNNNVLPQARELWLVSSCLIGLQTRYDGQIKPDQSCVQFLKDKRWIPVCPEQLGGLATPRVAASIIGGSGADVLVGQAAVITKDGQDVSEFFVAGATQVLQLVLMQDITGMCVKAGSPSCGLHGILGVTSSLLQNKGLLLKEF